MVDGRLGADGPNVQLHVGHRSRYEPETVLILSHRMEDLHVQGVGTKLRCVAQAAHAPVR